MLESQWWDHSQIEEFAGLDGGVLELPGWELQLFRQPGGLLAFWVSEWGQGWATAVGHA